MCCCGRIIRSQGNPLCLCASRVLVAGSVALGAVISTSFIVATSGKHRFAASGREDGTKKMGTFRIMLVLHLFLMAFEVRHVQLLDLLCLVCCVGSDIPPSGSHIEEPGVGVPPRDDMLCF